MTPERRALEVLDHCAVRMNLLEAMALRRLIAAVIRQAENDLIDRIKEWFDGRPDGALWVSGLESLKHSEG